jgi:hypothetical protein
MDVRKMLRVIVASGLGLSSTAGAGALLVGCGSGSPRADAGEDFPTEGPAVVDMGDVATELPREGPPPPPDMIDVAAEFPAEGPPPPPDMSDAADVLDGGADLPDAPDLPDASGDMTPDA